MDLSDAEQAEFRDAWDAWREACEARRVAESAGIPEGWTPTNFADIPPGNFGEPEMRAVVSTGRVARDAEKRVRRLAKQYGLRLPVLPPNHGGRCPV